MDVLDIARFWSKVEVKRSTEQCWLWRDKPDIAGYGEIKMDGKSHSAHRMAFQLAYGEVPEGLVVRHSCDTPLCCNPKHLLTGTHVDNVRDRVLRGRTARGSKNGRSKLNEAQVLEIRASVAHPFKLHRLYGVSIDTINSIRQGRIWRHI